MVLGARHPFFRDTVTNPKWTPGGDEPCYYGRDPAEEESEVAILLLEWGFNDDLDLWLDSGGRAALAARRDLEDGDAIGP